VTKRIYYDDPYAQEFDATAIEFEPDADPSARDRWRVVLDRTAFYPTSGGQPHDTGALGTARVVDVIDEDDGRIVHVVEGLVGGEFARGAVHGRIDWARRLDHMQQHTGQHVLSAAFDRFARAQTVSFHLGTSSSTIDLAREVSAPEIARAEAEANRIVWEDRPVTIRYADSADAAALQLRKEPARTGKLRIIEVDGFDVSACGGTHVARTGAIGIVAVAASERFKGGTRVEFVCGTRALESYRALRDTMTASVRLLSVLPSELPGGIERIQQESKDLKRQIKDLQSRLGAFEADALANHAELLGGARAVIASIDGLDANGLKTIATAIAAKPGHVAVLIATPAPFAIVIARASDVPFDAAALLKQLIAAHGGKGGGRPEMAQGGGLQGDAGDLAAAARAFFSGE
jgi:alanyl-tRNA synthetase